MLKNSKQGLRWRAANFDRIVSQFLTPSRDPEIKAMARTLRKEGYVTCDIREFLGSDAHYYDRLRGIVMSLWKSDGIGEKAEKNGGAKPFKVTLLDQNVDLAHPIMKLSLHPRILALVNEYMGLRAYLTQLDLWWDRPMPGDPMASQLWHRDLDDARNVKAFIYFNDVDAQTGPFTFMPRTHMFGEYAGIQPGGITTNRLTDKDMVAPLTPDKAKMFTGPAGTLIFCDTYGFHRGVKPEKDRLMSIFQYVSKAARYPRKFTTYGDRKSLSALQLQALDPTPPSTVFK